MNYQQQQERRKALGLAGLWQKKLNKHGEHIRCRKKCCRDLEKEKPYNRGYYLIHRERKIAESVIRMAEWKKNNPERLKEHVRRYYMKYKKQILQKQIVYDGGIKTEAIDIYSKGTMACACCGEKRHTDFLALDHINNDGKRHRAEKIVGRKAYRWAKLNGWPKIFQILCHNCNFARWIPRNKGICPHKHK